MMQLEFRMFHKNSNTGDTGTRVLFLAQCTYGCCISTCTVVNSPVNMVTFCQYPAIQHAAREFTRVYLRCLGTKHGTK